jgi:hypothetical protein
MKVSVNYTLYWVTDLNLYRVMYKIFYITHIRFVAGCRVLYGTSDWNHQCPFIKSVYPFVDKVL